jgi:hypothetical protein
VFWAGQSIAGLRLTAMSKSDGMTSFVYGDCTASGDSGCSPPLEIQVTSICRRNALLLDVLPVARFHTRRALVLEYSDKRLELSSARSQIVVWGEPALARRAIAELQPVGKPAAAALPAARYPKEFVSELRRVRDAGSVRAIRRELHISRSAAKFELSLARELFTDRAPQRQRWSTGPACPSG